MTERNNIAAVLNFDPLAAAEKLTGASYKTDEGTGALGFLMHIEHSRLKNAMLRRNGDTTLNETVERYQSVLDLLGFELVRECAFPVNDRSERDFIYAHRDGLLLHFDTFTLSSPPMVNGAHVWFNWRPAGEIRFPRGCSGGFCQHIEPPTLAGDYDAHEALIFNLGNLRADGHLVNPWVERPFLWLLNYGDTKTDNYNRDAINAARIAELPEWVRQMITPGGANAES